MAKKFQKFLNSVNVKKKITSDDFLNNMKSILQKIQIDIKYCLKIKNYSFFSESDLKINKEGLEFLQKDLFKKKLKKTTLLYKGTKDGFKCSSFHSLCDNKGPTLTIIKSHSDKIFGGFINDSWHSKGIYTYSKKSFLFSLDKKEKYEHKESIKSQSFYGNSGYGMTFGGGHDIYISNDCNINKNCYTNLGHTYKTTISPNYLAGEYNFSVEEIEVYSIEFL